ncbi:hypothetical protein [Catenuloplanes atrovinosus]|uniref:Uncharacterized protein n=1 Tax=Catenuloplanes atrovinosus TaxID=137266 RepID=A0AAE3YI11_9ACTN|nr:hypothetical protein [Catenuloplanes atrovinosus]MDR7273307.1 hypothetical protein [Catenuloplanes atrovinosus]
MHTHHRRPRAGSVLAAALIGLACALTVTTAPAAAKHCQTCEDKDAPLPGGHTPGSGTAG